MSTLSSWIDPEEMSELMPFLLPEKGEKDGAGKSEEPLETGAEIEVPDAAESDSGEIGTGEEGGRPASGGALAVEPVVISEIEVAITGAGANAETTGADLAEETPEDPPLAEQEPQFEPDREEAGPEAGPPSAGTNRDVDFDSPEAYDAAAFPDAGALSEGGAGPARQAAAVQAAVSLERARTRANEGGLLKKAPAAAAEDAAEDAGPTLPPTGEPDFEPEPEPEPTPESPEEPALETDSQPESILAPGTFRYRLAHFADTAAKLTGCSDSTVTDFQSYPLHRPANGRGTLNPRAVDSILRMNRMLGELPGRENGDRENTSQIALGEAEWLCILTQDSAAGGVCATFRVASPVPAESAEQLHQELHAALTGDPD